MDANCDIMFKILHEINPFGPMSCPETCDVRHIFVLTFFLCPHNYYNDNKKEKNTTKKKKKEIPLLPSKGVTLANQSPAGI